MEKKIYAGVSTLLLMLISLCACGAVGDKMTSMAIIYGVTTACALLLLLGYCCLIHKKEIWFLLLFSSVFIVNVGYLCLSLSKTLAAALWANRIAYLGSVFLPMSMLLIIMDVCKLSYGKRFPGILLGIGAVVFFIAASPGYLDIYYRSVTLEVVNGVTVLNKEYGPWHSLYLIYLLAYFVTMIVMICYAARKKKLNSIAHAVVLAAAVFVNIGVWLLEQLVKIDFGFLSVSYIISELFLISLYLLLQECGFLGSFSKQSEEPMPAPELPILSEEEHTAASQTQEFLEQQDYFAAHIEDLTPTERIIYDLYLQRKTTKEIMSELNIKENTLKYHNKNIYSKLGVSSRKQLVEIATALQNKRQ